MYECNSLSNLPLTIWCLNTLVYISGVICKPKLTYSVVNFLFLIECFAFVLFLLSSFVLYGLITSLHELPFERACKSWMSLTVLFEVAANWGYMLCYIEINRPCYFLTFSLAKLYII